MGIWRHFQEPDYDICILQFSMQRNETLPTEHVNRSDSFIFECKPWQMFSFQLLVTHNLISTGQQQDKAFENKTGEQKLAFLFLCF